MQLAVLHSNALSVLQHEEAIIPIALGHRFYRRSFVDLLLVVRPVLHSKNQPSRIGNGRDWNLCSLGGLQDLSRGKKFKLTFQTADCPVTSELDS